MSGRLIGLNGFAGSGKDEVFKRIKSFGLAPVRFAFADKLKVSAMTSLGMRYDALGNECTDEELVAIADVLKERGIVEVSVDGVQHFSITGRQYLQYKGTEGGRDTFGDTFWVDLVMAPAIASVEAGRLVAITDTRFPNEAEAVLAAGGEVWEVLGPEPEVHDDHPSETPLPRHLVTATIDNTVRDDNFSSLGVQLLELLGR